MTTAWIALGLRAGTPTAHYGNFVYCFRKHIEAQWFVEKFDDYKAAHPDNPDVAGLEFLIYPCEMDTNVSAFANFRDIIEEVIT